MAYTLKDVDDAEALVRELRPDMTIYRQSFDWELAIKEATGDSAIWLFRIRSQQNPEVRSTPDEIGDICFISGAQWTPEQIAKIKQSQQSRLH